MDCDADALPLRRQVPLRPAVLDNKHIEGFLHAGQPGHAPHPTVYDPVVSLDGVRRYARARGLRVVEEYGTDDVLPNSGRCRGRPGGALRSVQRLSGGRLTATHDHLGFVLEKPV